MIAIEVAEQLLARVTVARVHCHVRLVLDMRKLGPAGELTEGSVECLARRNVVLRHRQAIPSVVVLRLCLYGARLRSSTDPASTQVVGHFSLAGYALNLWFLEDLLALAA